MKFKDEEAKKKFTAKMAKTPEMQPVSVTAEHCLRLSGVNNLLISDYILFRNGEWFSGRNLTFRSSVPFPEKEKFICTYSLQKFLTLDEEDAVEFISPKKSASPGFCFVLVALLPNSISLVLIDSMVTPYYHFVLLPNTQATLEISVHMALRTILSAIPDGADELIMMWNGGV